MIFEDALKELRNGKKIRHPHWEPDECLMGCYVTINPLLCPEGQEDFEEVKKRGMSIVKMKGEHIHPDMRPISIHKKDPFYKSPCKRDDLHAYPQLNLLLIMQDNWEVME